MNTAVLCSAKGPAMASCTFCSSGGQSDRHKFSNTFWTRVRRLPVEGGNVVTTTRVDPSPWPPQLSWQPRGLLGSQHRHSANCCAEDPQCRLWPCLDAGCKNGLGLVGLARAAACGAAGQGPVPDVTPNTRGTPAPLAPPPPLPPPAAPCASTAKIGDNDGQNGVRGPEEAAARPGTTHGAAVLGGIMPTSRPSRRCTEARVWANVHVCCVPCPILEPYVWPQMSGDPCAAV